MKPIRNTILERFMANSVITTRDGITHHEIGDLPGSPTTSLLFEKLFTLRGAYTGFLHTVEFA